MALYEHWTEIEAVSFRGTCRCGWKGVTRSSRDDAILDMKAHKAEPARDHETTFTGNHETDSPAQAGRPVLCDPCNAWRHDSCESGLCQCSCRLSGPKSCGVCGSAVDAAVGFHPNCVSAQSA